MVTQATFTVQKPTADSYGKVNPSHHKPGSDEDALAAVVLHWHKVALDAALQDFSTTTPEGEMASPEQPVATYQSRAMAIAHIAIYDAYVAVTGDAEPYSTLCDVPEFDCDQELVAVQRAVAEAALRTLCSLYPRQTKILEAAAAEYLCHVAQHPDATRLGGHVADVLIKDRESDGFDSGPIDVVVTPGPLPPFEHQPDPTVQQMTLHAPHWGGVRPFGFADIVDAAQEIPKPLDLDYVGDYNEVIDVGRSDSCTRTADQTSIGIYWAYDGAYKIGTPNRIYNIVIDEIVEKVRCDATLRDKAATGAQLARIYAVANAAMCDASIRAWRDKYAFNFWRPAVGIPLAGKDGLPGTKPDKTWVALGSPATNTLRPPETPNFPSYPSGHATIGTAALVATNCLLDLPAEFKVTVVSEELDGVSTERDGTPRPKEPRTFTVEGAITENQDSRLFLGVHWRFDSTRGGELGRELGTHLAQCFPERSERGDGGAGREREERERRDRRERDERGRRERRERRRRERRERH